MDSQPLSDESSKGSAQESSAPDWSWCFDDSNILNVLSGIQFQSWLTRQLRNGQIVAPFRRAAMLKGVAIVFTDVVGSTRLLYEVGDYGYKNCLKNHFLRVRTLLKTHDGYELNSMGDGFLCVFTNVIDALPFALDLQEETGDEKVSVRVGIHHGHILTNSTEFGGQAIHFASRVLGHAPGADICVSDSVQEQIRFEIELIQNRMAFLDEIQTDSDSVFQQDSWTMDILAMFDKVQRVNALNWKEYPECTLKGIPGVHRLWHVVRDSV